MAIHDNLQVNTNVNKLTALLKMKRILTILILLNYSSIYSQSNNFIDSLKLNSNNKIIVFESQCNGCILTNTPCVEYANTNSKEEYVIWKSKKKFHIKRFNICGSSKTVTFKRWRNNPFKSIETKSNELDTTKILYPLSINRKDSTWSETKLNHFKTFNFRFITYNVDNISIKDYAFKEFTNDEQVWNVDIESRKNNSRYRHNNETAIKEILDRLQCVLKKRKRRLRIKTD